MFLYLSKVLALPIGHFHRLFGHFFGPKFKINAPLPCSTSCCSRHASRKERGNIFSNVVFKSWDVFEMIFFIFDVLIKPFLKIMKCLHSWIRDLPFSINNNVDINAGGMWRMFSSFLSRKTPLIKLYLNINKKRAKCFLRNQ